MASIEDAVEKRFAQLADGLLRVGTVTGTAAGGKVVVQIPGGLPEPLSRFKHYTPVIGDVVVILCAKKGAWIVLGTPAVS